MKAAKILGSQAPIPQNDAQRSADGTSLDIDFSDVAMAPSDSPPPIPLRSSAGAAGSLLPGSGGGSGIVRSSPHSGARTMYDSEHLHSGQLSLDPPLHQKSRNQEISPFLFQEENEKRNTSSRLLNHRHASASDIGPNSSGAGRSGSAGGGGVGLTSSGNGGGGGAGSTSAGIVGGFFSSSSSNPHGHHGSVQFVQRPSTPPAASSSLASSASQLSLAGATTPVHKNRSKNPLNKFFRKKSATTLREGEASPSSTPRIPAYGLPSGSTTAASSTQTSSIGSAAGLRLDVRGGIAGMVGVGGGGGGGGGSGGVGDTSQAVGLDEELHWDEGFMTSSFRETARKSKLTGRPRTRDKEVKRAKTADGERSEPGLGSSASAQNSFRQTKEVPISLDTNFDQIDDIVDVSFRNHQSMVGPMNEPLSPDAADGQIVNTSRKVSEPTSPTLARMARERSTSVSFVEHGRRSTSTLDSPAKQRPNTLRRLATATGSNVAVQRPMLQSQNSSPGPINLQRISRAEAHALIAARNASGGSTPTATTPQAYGSSSSSEDSMRRPSMRGEIDMGGGGSGTSAIGSDRRSVSTSIKNGMGPLSESNSLNTTPMTVRDDRKASYASTSSRLTNGSDISPTTSVNNLASRATMRPGLSDRRSSANNYLPSTGGSGGGGVDTGYKFPPNLSRNPTNEQRKASASSGGGGAGGGGGKVTSSWMAPDSWAVQEDTIRDALRDEEEEAHDESLSPRIDPLSNSPGPLKHDASARPSLTSSLWSNLASPAAHQSSISSSSEGMMGSASSQYALRDGLQSRRETIDSNVSTSSTAMERDNSTSNESAYEVLQTNGQAANVVGIGVATSTPHNVLSGTSAAASTSSQSQRPTSRGGSTIGHAAAAAAGKLGLHRPARIKITRPGTAGSLNGFPAPPKGQPTTPLAEEDYANASSWKLSKRTPTQAHHPINRHSFMRIYKDDGTHSVVSISLEATAAELRTILARKSVDPAKVNRLFVRDKGSERPLGESEKPAQLQRRRLMQAGYTEADLLDDIGREDLTFLLKFVYRSDKVTNFDSYSFGNTEADFNVLDLRNRNLEMVPIFLYRHGEWIKSLDLSGNPMHDVPLDFIQLCSNLTTLRLSNLSLKRIPQSIRQAVHLTHLDVSDNRIRDVAHVNLSDIPQLMSLKMQNNRLTDLPPYFAEMQYLIDLNVSNNRFDVFPAIVCQLSRLSQLDISFNTLTKLPEELSALTELQRLVLVGNSIEQLPKSMSKMTSLQAIDVRRNLLQHISSLFGLPRLEVLKCEHNSIKHLDVTFGARLKTLEIGQNPLSKATFAAPSMCALTVLNLSSANMGKLDDKVLSQLPNLTVLDLDRNNLIMLPENLGQLSQLIRLTCTNNILATLPDSIGLLGNLTELLVHNNNLKALPSSIWHCGNLRHINVSSNLLESFPNPNEAAAGVQYPDASMANSGILANPSESRKGSAGSLGPLPGTGGRSATAALPLSMSLTKLRLGDNHLSEDVFQSLSHLPELQILNLSSNELYEIPTYGLSHLVKLRELYLSGNSLGSIPADALPLLRELRILHINGNKLQTLPAEIGRMHKLVNFDVSNNSLKYNISNQQYDWNWNSNPNLHYLNLSGNKRFEIKSNPVMATPHQHAGQASSDGWRRTDSSDFQRLTSLRLLGLMDVTVTLQQMPDEFEDRRVRTSLSQINQMAYGISDTLGQHDHLSNIDVVIPRFRKRENECLFGLFSGRGHGERMGSRIAFHLAQWVNFRIQWEVQRLQPPGQIHSPDTAKVADIIRRAFLRMEKEYADVLISEASRSELKINYAKSDTPIHHGSSSGGAAVDSVAMMNWRSGASAVLAYVIDRTLFIANCGDALAVMSRNSTAHLVSTKHEPFDRNETLRIRSAEGWVSLQGEVNDTLDVSRSFGHYHLAPIVNAAPAVTQIELTDSDEFVILANRTLWDFIPYQTAVDIARMERDDLMLAAQKLRDYAIAYGAEDGIMVMVVAVGDLFEKTSSRNRQQTMTLPGGASTALDVTSTAASGMFEPQWDGFRKFKARHGGRDFLPGDRTIARLQREVAPPVGQVALVFTDIRNSTSLWETNGGMQSAMRIHNFLLRRQLRNIGGYEVKTEGDAFMVSFQTVTSALLWCFQVQIQLLKEPWPQEILESEDGKEIYDPNTGEVLYRGLSVRMGIHWGSPVCEADPITRRMDYFGPMVNRASRISGAAEGGQILASKDVVAELRAIMGTFDEDRRRTYMEGAGEQVTSPPAILEGMDEKEAEEAFRLLNQNVSRDVVLLRRMGFAISDVGERRLKGLETPEFLNLVYPKSLTGRFVKLIENASGGTSALRRPVSLQNTENGDVQAAVERAGGDVTAANVANADTANQILADAAKDGAVIPVEVFEPTIHLLSVDEVKTVGYLCLRLEALALGTVFEGIDGLVNAEQQQHLLNSPARVGSTTTTKKPRTFSHSIPIVGADRGLSSPTKATADVVTEAVGSLPVLPLVSQRQTLVENHLNHHPELTLPGMRDDATDEELYAVLLTLTSRIWIALGTLTVRKLVAGQNGGVEGLGLGVDISQILDALQDAFRRRE